MISFSPSLNYTVSAVHTRGFLMYQLVSGGGGGDKTPFYQTSRENHDGVHNHIMEGNDLLLLMTVQGLNCSLAIGHPYS